MKKSLILILCWFVATSIFAQAPLGFNYQGIARQADGTPITQQIIGIRISITDGPQGTIDFQEEHFPETNAFGLFTVIVGQGNGSSTLSEVNWAGGNLWLQIELDPNNLGSYILMGSQQLMSVPYALYSQESGGGLTEGYGLQINNGTISNVLPDLPITLSGSKNVQVTGSYPNFTIESNIPTDLDSDPANEIQTIAKVGSTVTLSNEGGSFIDEVNDADADVNNEIQDLLLVGNNLTITNNGTATTIDLSPYLDNTDTQLTEADVDGFVANNGYLTNETQDLSNVLSNGNSAGNVAIANLAAPINPQDAATKNYVDTEDIVLKNSITTNSSNITSNLIALNANTVNIGTNTTSIATEVSARTTADANIQAELDATQTGAGLNTDGSYIKDASTTYISTATSLQNADKLLDTQIMSNSSSISTLTGRLDNTFAFDASFLIYESGVVIKSKVVLLENIDSFNQINANEITIGATGLYLVIVDAERSNSDINFNLLYLRIEGSDTNIPLFSNSLNFGRTRMVHLVAGNIISLVATATGAMAWPVNGSISGFKISD